MCVGLRWAGLDWFGLGWFRIRGWDGMGLGEGIGVEGRRVQKDAEYEPNSHVRGCLGLLLLLPVWSKRWPGT